MDRQVHPFRQPGRPQPGDVKRIFQLKPCTVSITNEAGGPHLKKAESSLHSGAPGLVTETRGLPGIHVLVSAGNQLLATIALTIGTVYLVNNGKLRYAWTTAIPMVFVGITTFTAAVLSIAAIFWPLTHTPGTRVQGHLDSTLMTLFLIGVVAVAPAALRRMRATLHGVPVPQESFAAESTRGTDKIGCC